MDIVGDIIEHETEAPQVAPVLSDKEQSSHQASRTLWSSDSKTLSPLLSNIKKTLEKNPQLVQSLFRERTTEKHDMEDTLEYPPEDFMEDPPVTEVTFESISDLRFDFKGDITQNQKASLGLHHHQEDPHMAGYTLVELARLSRSVIPSQRCISIQTLGRILHNLGKHKFTVCDDEKQREFEKMVWDLVGELRIEESLMEAASEKTRNVSVRNYAVEALRHYRHYQHYRTKRDSGETTAPDTIDTIERSEIV
ncbi:hypothetical protein KGF56_002068 [Candida oxycetoniae]|uniref:RPAP1 C-terminal domain-containing protein n=1 Tax=Candida oxycetoniae TaxID=497107 RepID=A0AAI9SYU7_9ASCO|nr:uncharacterized protein KGF56_002068 [Candida oxycetoniae]KAI3405112.2 hypothetical protein KGF56_002068 [Candida oxycetoniae]